MTLRRSRRRGATIALAAAVLALVLPFGPGMAANASTPGSIQPGASPRGDVDGDGLADLAVGVGGKDSVALHNELLGSEPVDGAQVEAGPARIILTWDLPAQRGFSTIIVTGPDGNQWQAGPATEDGTVVSAPVRPLGPAGQYKAAYRIISADGHAVRGEVRFALTTPGTGTPAEPAAPNAATDTGSAGTPVWLWLAGAGALLVLGVVLALRARRTRV